MSINQILLDHDNFYDYGCWNGAEDALDMLLSYGGSFEHRQRKAIDVIEGVLAAHGKQALLQHVADLAKIEHTVQEIQPWLRDHVVHAVLTFALGVFINDEWMPEKVAPFQWKLASLLHDALYPIEVADNILASVPTKINRIARYLGFDKKIRSRTILEGLTELCNDTNALDLIQERLSEWNIGIDTRKEYERIQNERPCHGVYTSLAVLYVIDLMYEKWNPDRRREDIVVNGLNFNQEYFENDIVSACSAIFVHNLPRTSFGGLKIDLGKAPVAFLLKLCDALQEWERPSARNQAGIPSSKFHIEADNKVLRFYAPPDIVEKIRKEIYPILHIENIEIIPN